MPVSSATQLATCRRSCYEPQSHSTNFARMGSSNTGREKCKINGRCRSERSRGSSPWLLAHWPCRAFQSALAARSPSQYQYPNATLYKHSGTGSVVPLCTREGSGGRRLSRTAAQLSSTGASPLPGATWPAIEAPPSVSTPCRC